MLEWALRENWYALYLSIVCGYEVDEALIQMGIYPPRTPNIRVGRWMAFTILHDVCGVSYAEIARSNGLPRQTVRSIVIQERARAIEQIRKNKEAEDDYSSAERSDENE